MCLELNNLRYCSSIFASRVTKIHRILIKKSIFLVIYGEILMKCLVTSTHSILWIFVNRFKNSDVKFFHEALLLRLILRNDISSGLSGLYRRNACGPDWVLPTVLKNVFLFLHHTWPNFSFPDYIHSPLLHYAHIPSSTEESSL